MGKDLGRKLRLCFVSRYFTPMMGSGSTRVEDLSGILMRMGQEIHVVTIVPPRSFPKTGEKTDYIEKNRRVYRVRVPEGLPATIYALLSTLELFLETLKVTLRSNADVVWATVPNEDSGLAGWLAARITGRPLVLDVRDDWEIALIDETYGFERLLTKTIYYIFNILYASADAVVCTSDTLKRRISARRRSAKGVFKITNGARLELIRPLTESERRAVRRRYGVQGELVVFTGTLSSHQAPWNLVDAARELRSRGVKTSVVVAGGGPLLEELKRRSAEQGEPVRFVGSLSRDEATKLIAASDIGVITLRDSVACRSMIPLKFFDYVAGSLPIAASVPEDSEIAQMIIEEKLGIVVEPEDPIRLADAIEEMIKNKDSRLMSKKNAEEIAPRYDWRNLAETYLDLFFDLARRGTD